MKKTDKIIYWVATGLVSAMMLMSGIMYLSNNPEIVKGMATVGYPASLIPFLGVAKLLGAIALLIPAWEKVKEWAYAGLAFVFIGAVWTHIATSTPFVAPLVALIILSISYWFRSRLKSIQA